MGFKKRPKIGGGEGLRGGGNALPSRGKITECSGGELECIPESHMLMEVARPIDLDDHSQRDCPVVGSRVNARPVAGHQ